MHCPSPPSARFCGASCATWHEGTTNARLPDAAVLTFPARNGHAHAACAVSVASPYDEHGRLDLPCVGHRRFAKSPPCIDWTTSDTDLAILGAPGGMGTQCCPCASPASSSLALAMNPSLIRSVVESFYADVWNRHDKSKIASLLCEDFSFRGSLGQTEVGHDGFASYVDFVHEALADYRCDIVELVVEGGKAFARMRFSGIHRGVLFGHAPTGKPVEWAGSALFTFNGDRVADLWVLGDVHGLMQLLKRNVDE